ncbi:MAG TPA: hypothetical protein VNS19_07955 [Acidimicrobiales bacterium]|nr:hypothetical protein [Acidimicrobiales bacterium]
MPSPRGGTHRRVGAPTAARGSHDGPMWRDRSSDRTTPVAGVLVDGGSR